MAAVWRSGFSPRIVAYRRQHGLDLAPKPPAVLVQRMIDACVSGVAFSADPVSGRRGIAVVSALPGLGTGIVSGECDSDTWQVDRGGAITARSDRSACGPLRPYKWYVAAYRTDRNDARWTKAIGVLTERNWIADTGRIHGAGDQGPNPAAEIAMQIAARHAGYVSGDGK